MNGHAWFHLQRLRWPVRNGEGAKNSKWKYMSPAGFEPTHRQSTTGKSQRLRPLGPRGCDGDQWLNVLQDNGIQFLKKCYVTTRVNLIMVTCAFELNVRLNFHFLSHYRFLASIIIVYRTLHWVSYHNRFHTGIVTYPFQNTVRLKCSTWYLTSVAERSKALWLSCRGLAWLGFESRWKHIFSFLNFSLPPRSEQVNGAPCKWNRAWPFTCSHSCFRL